MGHVPTGPLSGNGEGPHLPRRKHRGSRPTGPEHLADRRDLAGYGESVAAWFLIDNGLSILGRNVQVGRGEVDIVAHDASRLVVVEVRTVTGSLHPLDAITDAKRLQVRRLANTIRVGRCDGLGIGVLADGVVVHWYPDLF